MLIWVGEVGWGQIFTVLKINCKTNNACGMVRPFSAIQDS